MKILKQEAPKLRIIELSYCSNDKSLNFDREEVQDLLVLPFKGDSEAGRQLVCKPLQIVQVGHLGFQLQRFSPF